MINRSDSSAITSLEFRALKPLPFDATGPVLHRIGTMLCFGLKCDTVLVESVPHRIGLMLRPRRGSDWYLNISAGQLWPNGLGKGHSDTKPEEARQVNVTGENCLKCPKHNSFLLILVINFLIMLIESYTFSHFSY